MKPRPGSSIHRGTSPHVWNAWKGRLLEELYVSTSRVLRRGHGEPIRIEDRIGDVKSEVLANIADKRLSPQLVEEYWSALADVLEQRQDDGGRRRPFRRRRGEKAPRHHILTHCCR